MLVEGIVEDARLARIPFTILGGSGFIGSHLSNFLLQSNIPFSCPARGDESIFARPLGHVIYAVGLTADYSSHPFATVEAHVSLVSRLLENCEFSSFLYLSSTRLYDGAGSVGREDRPLVLDPTNPRHIFDLSKGLGEALCIQTRRNARVARLSSVYAEDLSGSNFLNQMVRASANGRPEIDSSAELARDYIDVRDVSPLLVAISQQGRRPIYNVASGENLTNQQVLTALAQLSGHVVVPARPAIAVEAPVISIDGVLSDFHFRPRSLMERLPALFASARRG